MSSLTCNTSRVIWVFTSHAWESTWPTDWSWTMLFKRFNTGIASISITTSQTRSSTSSAVSLTWSCKESLFTSSAFSWRTYKTIFSTSSTSICSSNVEFLHTVCASWGIRTPSTSITTFLAKIWSIFIKSPFAICAYSRSAISTVRSTVSHIGTHIVHWGNTVLASKTLCWLSCGTGHTLGITSCTLVCSLKCSNTCWTRIDWGVYLSIHSASSASSGAWETIIDSIKCPSSFTSWACWLSSSLLITVVGTLCWTVILSYCWKGKA